MDRNRSRSRIVEPVSTCARCQRLLLERSNVISLCPECEKKDKEDYEIVHDYIANHANTSVLDLVKNTSVSLKVVLQFISEDRVQIVEQKEKL